MSDLELQKVGQDPTALTELAFEALQREMARRGLDWPGKDICMDCTFCENENGFRRSRQRAGSGAKVSDMPEAMAARMTLESAGIDCYLYDETVVRMDWLWSNLWAV